MSDELVRVRDLKKIFSVPAGELHAVDGVDFSIARGSTIGIVGESGCGKSTMGRLLAMLLEATSGEILFDGQNIAKKMSKAEAMAYKKRIQMIFQDPFSSLNPRMTESIWPRTMRAMLGTPLMDMAMIRLNVVGFMILTSVIMSSMDGIAMNTSSVRMMMLSVAPP